MVIFVSRYGQRTMRWQWGGRRFRSVVIPPGVAPSDDDELEFLEADVVFLGRLVSSKDPLLAVRAFQLAREVEPTAKLLVFGDGPLRGALEAAAQEPVSGGTVVIQGHTADPVSALRNAGILVLTSKADSENSPYAILEAMRAGRAIVATSVGDVPDMLAHGKAGMLVQPSNTESVAQGLRSVLGDPALRQRLGSEASVRLRAHYGLDGMIESTLAVYAQLTSAPLEA